MMKEQEVLRNELKEIKKSNKEEDGFKSSMQLKFCMTKMENQYDIIDHGAEDEIGLLIHFILNMTLYAE